MHILLIEKWSSEISYATVKLIEEVSEVPHFNFRVQAKLSSFTLEQRAPIKERLHIVLEKKAEKGSVEEEKLFHSIEIAEVS